MDVLSVGEATLWEKTSLMDPSNTASISEKEDTDLQKKEGNEQQHRKEKRFWSVRYGLAVMIHGSNLISTSQTFGLSIAIIAMVNNTGQSNQSNLYASTDAQVPVYEWSPEDQGLLLSSFLYGTLISIIPGGYVAGVLGGKKIAGFSLFISLVLNLLIPVAADHGLTYLILTRIVQGLAQGMNVCALQAFWPKWAPPLERTQMSNIGFSGLTLGNFIIILVGGFLCQSLGWPSTFYICGGIGCAYSIIWFFLVYDDPTNHPFISDSEKEYIVSSLAGQDSSPHWSMPIKAMMTSLPLWAIIFASFCRFWFTSNLATSLPMLLDNIFDYSLEKVSTEFLPTVHSSNGLNPETAGKNVFLVSSGISLLGMIFFLIFGKAEVQDWAKENTITP
ncbi:probable small intestine urate exporter [Monodelphis domestica]|uniref:probable small intestine urate exporter n=1 Tax=Monodelphis domestica TaxID=13616 RepID=UPI0024E26EEC|nr:probable small intestine urate exporter [Monodelphis domestica]